MEKELIEQLNWNWVNENVSDLLRNARQAWSKTAEKAAAYAVRHGNELLWKVNKPISVLNRWLQDHCSKLEKLEKKSHEKTIEQLAIERMDDEGGAMMPTEGSLE